jgi:hypothetical protein
MDWRHGWRSASDNVGTWDLETLGPPESADPPNARFAPEAAPRRGRLLNGLFGFFVLIRPPSSASTAYLYCFSRASWPASFEQGTRYSEFCHDNRSQSGSCWRHREADYASAHCAAALSRSCVGRKGQDRARASGRSIRRLTFRARMGRVLSLPPDELTSKLISRDREMVHAIRPLLSLRRCRLRGLQYANPHPPCGKKDRGTRLGGPSDVVRTLRRRSPSKSSATCICRWAT